MKLQSGVGRGDIKKRGKNKGKKKLCNIEKEKKRTIDR
jgi:hypothetical protein